MQNIIRLENLEDSRLDIYRKYSEVQLLHFYEPAEGVFIAESPIVIGRALDAGYEPFSFLVEEKQLEQKNTREVLERCQDIPVFTSSLEMLNNLTGFSLTRGMLCAMRRKTLPTLEEVCKAARRIAILEDVVNPTNVGAIVRSAAALHVDAILFTSPCADPLYRRAIRVSMGTIFQIPWTVLDKQMEWPKEGFCRLRELGFVTVAMALTDQSVSIDDPEVMSQEKLAIILGTEGEGLKQETIDACDFTVRIPMSHGVDSLNVAAASAVAFWQLCK